MRAAICRAYGPPEVVEVGEIPAPVPRDDEYLVRVGASAVNSGDARVRAFRSPPAFWIPMRLALGITKPRNPVLGVAFAGEIVGKGPKAGSFAVGEKIFGLTGLRMGGHGEYLVVREGAAVSRMPAGAGCADAAVLPFGGATSLDLYRRAGLRAPDPGAWAGKRILVYGASGSVGCAALQLAKAAGADATAVCGEANLAWARGLGADAAVDYRSPEFDAMANGPSGDYDVVFDAVGFLPRPRAKGLLGKGGAYVTVEGTMTEERADDVARLARLFEAGALKPCAENAFPLDRIVEAHRLVDGGHKRGNVALLVG